MTTSYKTSVLAIG